jgi:hypothetical protein
MDYNKLNGILGFSAESIEKIRDFFYKISQLKIKLSKEEKILCKSIGIDEHLARIVKSHNACKIKLLPNCNQYGEMDFNCKADGICAFYVRKNIESTSEIYRVIYRNKQKYFNKGYNLFVFEAGGYEHYYMALVKGKTDIDILKWRQTNGINHNIDNSKLIAKIEQWQQKYDLVLWGCGGDWLRIFFIHEEPEYNSQLGRSNKKYYEKRKIWKERTPEFKKFAEEVYEFCPDIVTQGAGNKKNLIETMRQMNGVYLWWD